MSTVDEHWQSGCHRVFSEEAEMWRVLKNSHPTVTYTY